MPPRRRPKSLPGIALVDLCLKASLAIRDAVVWHPSGGAGESVLGGRSERVGSEPVLEPPTRSSLRDED